MNKQNTSLNINDSNRKNKKIVLAIVFIIIALFCIILGVVMYKNTNKELLPNNNDTNNDSELLTEADQLWYDFNNGLITTDEYVRYNLYNLYDTSKLDEKYVSSTPIRIDDLITKYSDELSEETLKLYIDYYSLSNLTFKLDDNKAQVEPLANTIADENAPTTNLNEVYLSSNGNFLLWYTTEGDSAVDYSKVQQYAELLENVIVQYDSILGIDYSLNSTIIAKETERYKEQINILKSKNIDEKYFKDAMHIYIYDLNSSNIQASYNSMDISSNWFVNFGNNYFYNGIDQDGTIIIPYMLLNSNLINDDTINYAVTVAHELFHHYQNYIIDNNGVRNMVNDTVIGEATAQWAAAKIMKNDFKNANINNWVVNYLRHTSDILTDMYDEYGGQIGYALGNFMYCYENNVSDGMNKILNSIHADDGFKYLSDNSTAGERNNVMKNLALKSLNNDYPNNNYLPNRDGVLKIKKEIEEKGYSSESDNLSAIGIDYYSLSYNYNYEIRISALDNSSINAYLIELVDGKYKIISSHLNIKEEISILTHNYYNYDKLYLVIVNSDFINSINYKISINQTEKKPIKNTVEFKTDFNNYRFKATSTVMMYGMETISYIEGVVDESHKKEYLKTTTEVLGMSISIDTYVDFYNGYTYTQNPLTGVFEKTAGATSMIDLSIILDKFKETGNVTEVTQGHYLVKLEKEDIQGLLKYNGTLNEYNLEGEIFVNVYVKDNYVSKLEYDFSNLIAEIEKFHMTIEFYDHNKAGDVTIPVEVAG